MCVNVWNLNRTDVNAVVHFRKIDDYSNKGKISIELCQSSFLSNCYHLQNLLFLQIVTP